MSLTSVNFVTQSSWTLIKSSVTGFNPPKQTDTLSGTLSGIDTSVWNQIYVASLNINAAGSQGLNLTSLTNLVSESFAFGHVKALYLVVNGGDIKIGPGASNGLQWFWDDATAFTTITDGGMYMYSDSASNTGTVVDSSNKNLTITNLESLATAWSGITAYVVGNKVSLLGVNYICILNNIGHTPPNATYWTVTDLAIVDINILGRTT